eukprot:TRINITY_DN96_c0_g1_i7.p1 TRINITY_DN96_c0_g1~~TRINITY_DN96_c0_g1_i7.p1  ORF type:complete len:4713 (-),score=554.72 TRINITY_DN96_c0_g1_i7:428-12508(-)
MPGLLTASDVTRLSASVISITLPSSSEYAISADEVLSVTVPASSVVEGISLSATPNLTVTDQSGVARVSGSIHSSEANKESDIIQGGSYITVSLTGARFDPNIGSNHASTTGLIAGLTSAQSESNGWNAIVKPSLTFTSVDRVSDTVVNITLPPFSNYAISAPESIAVLVPAAALVNDGPLTATPSLTIANAPPASARLSGSFLLSAFQTETNVISGGNFITLELIGDTWVPTVGNDNPITTALLQGLTSSTSSSHGWNSVIRPALTHANVVRVSNRVVNITLPAFPYYAIAADEVVSALIPSTSLSEGAAIAATPSFTIRDTTPGIALITGSIQDGSKQQESDLISGSGSTIVVTLSAETWVPTLGTNNAFSAALLNGISSTTFEAEGWNNVIRPTLSYTAISRDSDHQITITLPAFSSYAINANETIVVTIPGVAVTSGTGLVGNVNLTIIETAGSATLSGSIQAGTTNQETDIVDGGASIVISLSGETFVSSLGTASAATTNLLNALTGSLATSNGWNSIMRPLLTASHVTRVNAQEVRITLPPATNYSIDSNEVLSLTLPSNVLVSSRTPTASPTLTILDVTPTVVLTGTIQDGSQNAELDIRTGGATIILDVISGTFVPTIGNNNAITTALITGMASALTSPSGFNNLVRPAIGYTNVTRVSNTQVSVTLPAVPGYDISASELITATVPATALTAATSVIATPVLLITDSGTATALLSGTLGASPSETDIINGGKAIEITLQQATFAPIVGLDNGATSALLAGLGSSQNEATGWNAAVKPSLDHSHVVRVNDSTVRISLPGIPGYAITATENLVFVIPAIATSNPADIVATPFIQVSDSAATVSLTGSIQDGTQNKETDIIAGSSTIIATVKADTWASLVGGSNGITSALLAGLSSTQSSSNGWNNLVKPSLTSSHITRLDSFRVAITLPSVGSYAIASDEVVTFSVPGSSFTGGTGAVATPTLTIANSSPTISVAGTLTVAPTNRESAIRVGGSTLSLSLTADVWNSSVGTDSAATAALILGLTSAQSEPTGWNAVVKAALAHGDVSRVTSQLVTVTLPTFAGFAITADETLSVSLPASTLAGNSPVSASTTISIFDDTGTASITGTIQDTTKNSELDIVNGGATITITLTADRFVATVGDNNAITSALIAGISEASVQAGGWSNRVKPALTHAHVTRVNDLQVRITLPSISTYFIAADEVLTVTIPSAALAGGASMIATPTLTITDSLSGTAAITGTIQDATKNKEEDIVAGGSTIVITLTSDQWQPSVGGLNGLTLSVLNGIVSSQNEASGFNSQVKPLLTASHLVRNSNTVVTITLPPVSGYSITASESLVVTIPNAAIVGTVDVVATPSLTLVNKVQGTATVSGLITTTMNGEGDIILGGATIDVTLTSDTWASTIGVNNGITTAFLNGITAASTQLAGWTNVVKAGLDHSHVTRVSDSLVRVSLPPFPGFAITANEDITVAIPSSTVTSGNAPVMSNNTFIIIDNGVRSASLSGIAGLTEGILVATGRTLTLTLTADAWDPTIGGFNSKTTALIAGLVSAQSEAGGFNARVRPALSAIHIVRVSNQVVSITLPVVALYSISANEIVTVTIPSTALVSGQSLGTSPATFTIMNQNAASAVLSGAVQTGVTEAQVTTGGQQLIITLSSETWGATVGGNNAVTTALINGISASGSEPTGFNAVVKPLLSHTNVVRASATVVTITLPASLGFAISANEVLVVTVPASAVAGSADVPASNTGLITLSSGSAIITGTIQDSSKNLETDIIDGTGSTIVITLVNDAWISSIGANNGFTTALLAGITSAGSESNGWNAIVKPALTFAAVTRVSNTVVSITIPALSDYAISTSETVSVTVPASCVIGSGNLAGDTAVTVANVNGIAILTGSIQDGSANGELAIISGASTLILTLRADTWISGLGSTNALSQPLTNGINSAQSESYGFNAAIRPHLTSLHVTRLSNRVAIVTLPPAPLYAITSDETLTVTVPSSMLAGSAAAVASPTATIRAASTRSVAVTGSIQDGTSSNEMDIINGGSTIVLTTTADTWVAGVGGNNAITTALINGLTSSSSDPQGWNNVVKAALSSSDVTRTSDHVVTITLPPAAAYAISSAETVVISVPASALTEGVAVVATPSISISNAATPTVTVGGSLVTPLNTELSIIRGLATLTLSVRADTFVPSVGGNNAITSALINGIKSSGTETWGWNSVVVPGLNHTHVSRVNASTVEIDLPVLSDYVITSDESVSVTIPAAALTENRVLSGSPAINIKNSAGIATLSGTIPGGKNGEFDIINGGQTILVKLEADLFQGALGGINAFTDGLIAGFVSNVTTSNGWNNIVTPGLTATHVTLLSKNLAQVTLPAFNTYAISADEKIILTVPSVSVLGSAAITATPAFEIHRSTAPPILLVNGTLKDGPDDSEFGVIIGGGTITLRLLGATWDPTLGSNNALTTSFLNSFSGSHSPSGWNDVVSPGLTFAHVTRTTNQLITLTLPAFSGYSIVGGDESVNMTIPGGAHQDGQQLFNGGFKIRDLQGPTISTLEANDPDNLDAVYSTDDAFDVVFAEATNQVNATTDAQVRALLSFPAGAPGSPLSGTWVTPSRLRVTLLNVTLTPVIDIGTFRVQVKQSASLRGASITNPIVSDSLSPVMSGNWGTRAGPQISSMVADDPDDADPTPYTLSAGDIITFTFNEATNQPNATTKADLDDLFTITGLPTSQYTGVWASATSLVVTLVDVGTDTTTPTGVSFTVKAAANLNIPGNVALASTSASSASGDWGLPGAPRITSMTATGSGDKNTTYSPGDKIIISFDTDTAKPDVSTKSALDAFLTFTQDGNNVNLGRNITAKWTSATTLEITVHDPRDASPIPRIGGLTVVTKKNALKRASGPTSEHTTSTAVLGGSWGYLDAPVLISACAGDPDNKDAVYGDGDVIRLLYDRDTNQPSGSPSSLFSFSESLGNVVSGTWVSRREYVVTVVDSTGASPPVIGRTVVTGNGQVFDAAGKSSGSISSQTLGCNFGTYPGPIIARLEIKDPDNQDGVFSDNDQVILTFSEPTNTPNVTSMSDIKGLFTFPYALGSRFSASWQTDSQLVITIVNATLTSQEMAAGLKTPPFLWDKYGLQLSTSWTITQSGSIRPKNGTVSYGYTRTFDIAGNWGDKMLPVELAYFNKTDYTYVINFKEAGYRTDYASPTLLSEHVRLSVTDSRPLLEIIGVNLLQAQSADLVFGQDFSGAWTTPKTFVISVPDSTSGYNPLVTNKVPQLNITGGFQDLAQRYRPLRDQVDFLLPGPSILSFTAEDPDASEAEYAFNDTMTLEFNMATNTPPVTTKTLVDEFLSCNQQLGADYSGTWASDKTLRITVLDPLNASPPTVGFMVCQVRHPSFRDSQLLTLAEKPITQTLDGDFGRSTNIVDGGGRVFLGDTCKTFWCLWWWLLLLATILSIVGCMFLVAFCGKQRELKRLEAEAEREKELRKTMLVTPKPVTNSKPMTDFIPRIAAPMPSTKTKQALPSLPSAMKAVRRARGKSMQIPPPAAKPGLGGPSNVAPTPVARELKAMPKLKTKIALAGRMAKPGQNRRATVSVPPPPGKKSVPGDDKPPLPAGALKNATLARKAAALPTLKHKKGIPSGKIRAPPGRGKGKAATAAPTPVAPLPTLPQPMPGQSMNSSLTSTTTTTTKTIVTKQVGGQRAAQVIPSMKKKRMLPTGKLSAPPKRTGLPRPTGSASNPPPPGSSTPPSAPAPANNDHDEEKIATPASAPPKAVPQMQNLQRKVGAIPQLKTKRAFPKVKAGGRPGRPAGRPDLPALPKASALPTSPENAPPKPGDSATKPKLPQPPTKQQPSSASSGAPAKPAVPPVTGSSKAPPPPPRKADPGEPPAPPSKAPVMSTRAPPPPRKASAVPGKPPAPPNRPSAKTGAPPAIPSAPPAKPAAPPAKPAAPPAKPGAAPPAKPSIKRVSSEQQSSGSGMTSLPTQPASMPGAGPSGGLPSLPKAPPKKPSAPGAAPPAPPSLKGSPKTTMKRPPKKLPPPPSKP